MHPLETLIRAAGAGIGFFVLVLLFAAGIAWLGDWLDDYASRS